MHARVKGKRPAGDGRTGRTRGILISGPFAAPEDRKIVLTSEHLLFSLDFARLALRFPNRDVNAVSGANQQLR